MQQGSKLSKIQKTSNVFSFQINGSILEPKKRLLALKLRLISNKLYLY
jgi:hypothetical protein